MYADEPPVQAAFVHFDAVLALAGLPPPAPAPNATAAAAAAAAAFGAARRRGGGGGAFAHRVRVDDRRAPAARRRTESEARGVRVCGVSVLRVGDVKARGVVGGGWEWRRRLASRRDA